jgi:hypothetical protein
MTSKMLRARKVIVVHGRTGQTLRAAVRQAIAMGNPPAPEITQPVASLPVLTPEQVLAQEQNTKAAVEQVLAGMGAQVQSPDKHKVAVAVTILKK